MKKKDIQELKNRPLGELEKMAKEEEEKLRSLRFDLAAGKVKNVSQLRDLRKKLARVKTFMKQKNA